MSRAQRIPQTFTGTKEWLVQGGYFKLLTATYPVTIELFKDGAPTLYAASAEAGFYQRVDFDLVRITNPISQETAFLCASADGGSDRLAGEVSVISGEISRVKNGNSFVAFSYGGAVAGQYQHVQLWNPADSGLNAFVTGYTLYTGAAGRAALRKFTAALASSYAPAANPINKNLSGAVSSLENRYAASAAYVGDQIGALLRSDAATSPIVAFSEPIMVPPGYGIGFANVTVNEDIGASIQFFSESVL